jgi:hypothetical protein
MPLMKRATRQLQQTYPNLEVYKGIWGYYCLNKKYSRQYGTLCRDKITQVLRDVLERNMFPQRIDYPTETHSPAAGGESEDE